MPAHEASAHHVQPPCERLPVLVEPCYESGRDTVIMVLTMAGNTCLGVELTLPLAF